MEKVNLTCECGKQFAREKVPDEWMKNVHYKWKFRYCDDCFKKKAESALKHLPEVINALEGAQSIDNSALFSSVNISAQQNLKK